MPRVETARLMERPALARVRRMSGRRSKICTGNPRCAREIASRGPVRPAPTSVMVWELFRMLRTDAWFAAGSRLKRSSFQIRSRFPQFREEFLFQRVLQVGRAGAAARSHANANRALDHLNVAKAPAYDEFVELGEAFAYVNPVAMIALVAVERVNGFGASLKVFFLGGAGGRGLQRTQRFESLEKNIAQGILAQAAEEDGVSFRSELVVAEHFFVFQAAEEFELAELFGLKTAGWSQLSAKCEEVRGQHRFEDGELLDQDAHYFRAAAQQARGFIHTITRGGIFASGAQVCDDSVEIVEQFLEPELVGLVNDDEKQFIVVLGRGFGMLEAQQFRNPEIGAVGELLPGAGVIILAGFVDSCRTGVDWTTEGIVCLRCAVCGWRGGFLRQAEPGLRVRAEQFGCHIHRKLAFANERADALFTEWERIVGAEQDAVLAHDFD